MTHNSKHGLHRVVSIGLYISYYHHHAHHTNVTRDLFCLSLHCLCLQFSSPIIVTQKKMTHNSKHGLHRVVSIGLYIFKSFLSTWGPLLLN